MNFTIACKCDTCKIEEAIRKSNTPACCKWYMDNVVCGDKTPKDCPDYDPIKGK